MRFVLAAVLLSSVAAAAAEPVVPVQVEVVQASTKPGEVPVALQKMHAALSTRVKYNSMKVFSSTRLMLKRAPETVRLPNDRDAALTLVHLRDNVATLEVTAGAMKATYTLAQEKSLYFQAGTHQGDDLWLVLSQPR